MNIIKKGLFPFDYQFPLYNFYYPFSGVESTNTLESYINGLNETKKRALYFHIPFCDTICSFCPFTRGMYSNSEVNKYVDALIYELEYKTKKYNLNHIPINAIFFGGGTPSVLSVENILKIGAKIHELYNLSDIKEFSFEIEVKSISKDKVNALLEIGVTHPRFGVQSFSSKWRDIFNLTSTLEEVYSTIELLGNNFNNVSFDILYGMSGQTEEEIVKDLDTACCTGVTNIDIYPIDNIMSQPLLHNKLKKLNYFPTSAVRKGLMNIIVNNYMRSMGYFPHNGHGYRKLKVDDYRITYNEYKFEYHNHVYGYDTYDLIGFGSSAISIMDGIKILNTNNKNNYIEKTIKGDVENIYKFFTFAKSLFNVRPLVFHLAYFGYINLEKINKDAFLLFDIQDKLTTLENYGLIKRKNNIIELTQVGFYNYVNIMYYLLPDIEKERVEHFIAINLENKSKDITEMELFYGL